MHEPGQAATSGIKWAPAAFRQAAWLLLAATLVTTLSWALRGDKLPLTATAAVYELELAAPLLTMDQALVLYDEGNHLFIDTRDHADDPREIPGSFRIRTGSLDADLRRLLDDIYPEDPLILYGSGELLSVSNVAVRLQERGYEDVQILGGGLQTWQDAGGELSPFAPETGGADGDG